MTDISKEQKAEITRKLVTECLERIITGDPDAGFELATHYLGELPSNEIQLSLIVAESLVRQAASLGSKDAQEYLENTWPDMRKIMLKRLKRRGLSSEWSEDQE